MKTRIVVVALLAAFLTVIGWRISLVRRANATRTEVPAQLTLIRTAQVRKADIAERVSFTGTVRPRNDVDIYPKVGGRIESLSADVGDKINPGQVLAIIEHKEIAWQAKAAQAALDVARANLGGAELDWNRTVVLHKGGSAPQAQLDAAKMRLDLAKAQVAQAEAAAGLASQQVDNARITSPIGGTVTRRPVNLGAQVGPQSVLFTIQDVAALKLESSVDAQAFVRLAKDAPARVTVDALRGDVFQGRVALLSPSLDAQTRRAQVQIEIDNAAGRLLPNMFASANVLVGRLVNVLVVPRDAVLEGAGGAVVYRVRGEAPRAHVELIRPHLGSVDGDRVAVLDGLAEGDEVAVTALGSLVDGAPVSIAPATHAELSSAAVH